MTYKGYRIVANARRTVFFNTNEDGEALEKLTDVQYFDVGDDELWYSVVDKEGWVEQSFETIKECKEYVDEEISNGV